MRRHCLGGMGLVAGGLAAPMAASVALALDVAHVTPAGDVRTTGFGLGVALLLGLSIAAGAVGLTLLYLCGLRSLPRFDDAPAAKATDTHRAG